MKKIKSISVINSPFFEDLKIDFSDNLNCIMGGRGTGKSTLLFFIKSAIFENAEDDKTIYSILKSNLGGGEISVELESEDGVYYRIIKTFNDFPQPYRHPNSEYVPINKIFEDIECDFYETGKIEEIGRSKKDRLQLIDKKIKSEIVGFQAELKQVQIDLNANAQDIKTFNLRLQRIEESIIQYEGIEEDFEAQKQRQPAGLKDEEKNEFEDADSKEKIRKNEKRLLNKLIERFSEFRIEIEQISTELTDTSHSAQAEKETYINKKIMDEVISSTQSRIETINSSLNQISSQINTYIEKLDKTLSSLNEKHDIQQAEFVKIKQKFEEHRDYINKYNLLSKRKNEKEGLIKDKEELSMKRIKIKEARIKLINKLNKLKQNIFQIRLTAINSLNEEFEGAIVINLTFSGITDEFEDKLRESLKGSGLRYNELIPRIVENFSCNEFASVVHARDFNQLKAIAGIDESRSTSIIEALFETDSIYEIESMYSDDLPEFKLRIHEGKMSSENYRNSEELSMGQRCTTVLPIIFAVSDNPLIIDQPEDNLDNKYISGRIHSIIRKQKKERQLILITHNPNIPVLSESEHNIFLKFDRKASVDTTGIVDEVKLNIVELLEGGEEAFKTRKETYGY